MIQETGTVEDHFIDAFFDRTFRNQFSYGLGRLRVVRLFELSADFLLNGGSADQRVAALVVNDLSLDVHVAAENGKTRAFRCSDQVFTHSIVLFRTICLFGRFSNH